MAPALPSPVRPALFAACGLTHPGQVREDNEDALGIFVDDRLFVVADGMGGRAAGDVAAQLAVHEIEGFFHAQRSGDPAGWPWPHDPRVAFEANLMRVCLKVANRRIREEAQAPALARMGAAVVALALTDTHVIVSHVGDARAYRYRAGALSRLTRDHSLHEEMRAARPDVRKSSLPTRNVLTRALGPQEEVEPTVYMNTFMPGDLFLLCSDGLWSCLDDVMIATVLGSEGTEDELCQRLLDAADAAGAPDNVTALLVQLHGEAI